MNDRKGGSSVPPIVDTHFHMWEPKRFNYKWPTSDLKIYRDFLPEDYKSEMVNTPIQHSVFVEVYEDIKETKWVLRMAEDNPFIKGVVGFVELTCENLEEEISELKKNPKFVGTRKILFFCEEDWLERDDVIHGMEVLHRHNLTFDLLVQSPTQYASAKRFLNKVPPGLKIVLDHLGKPNIKDGADQTWYDDIVEIASHQNVYCKLSGMVTEADLENWTESDFKVYVDHVIGQFGIDRVMFGSDWPVCKLAGANLPDVYKLLERLLSDLSVADKAKVFGENAVKFYNLKLD